MKKLLILCLPFLFIFSCTDSDKSTPTVIDTPVESTPQPVKITGTITNPVSETVQLRGDDVNQKAEVKDGEFVLDFELKKPTHLTFKHGTESAALYLEPGDEVTLTLDPKMFDETLKLAGNGAEESNYLLEKYLVNESMGEDIKAIYSKPEKEFLQTVANSEKQLLEHFNKFVAENKNANPDFIKSEKSSIVYETATDKLNYPGYFEYFTGGEKPQISANYFSFMDKVDLNNQADYENNKAYGRMVRSYINQMGEKSGEGTDFLKGVFDVADKKISNEKIKTDVVFMTLVDFLENEDAAGTTAFVEKFKGMTTDEQLLQKVTDTYTNATRLMKGKPAPTFTYVNTKGKEVALENLKGKNVYVDVWATWCGPCKREIPHLKELEAAYHDNKDMVFMSVSIDKMADKEKWLTMVDEKELTGIQLMADQDWKSSICQDYSIFGIPRFILIDKDGNILDKNAPRPSSKKIKEVLASLTGKNMTSMK